MERLKRAASGFVKAIAVAATVASAFTSTLACALTQIDFVSDLGDYIGNGHTFSLTPADGDFTVWVGFDGSVQVAFHGPGPSPATWWFLEYAPIGGRSLAPGNYASAQRSSFKSPTHPGLDISGDGRGCNRLSGSFTIHELVRDAANNVTAFAADAVQHCEGLEPALHVRVRFDSNVPLQLAAPQALAGLAQEVSENALVTLDGSQSYDPDGHIARWRWSQVAGPPARIESPDDAVTMFRAPDVDAGGADLRFLLVVTDDDGNQATDTIDVHVFDRRDRRNLLVWRSPPGDYIGDGVPLVFTAADGDAHVDAVANGAAAYFMGGAFNQWTLQFYLPAGPFAIGRTYAVPGADAGQLKIYGSGRGCNDVTGQFTVLENEIDAVPQQFAARFVQSCEGFMPALRGTVLVNAAARGDPVARIHGAPSGPPGAVVTLDGSRSSSTGSELVAYKWRQIGGPPVTVDDPSLPVISFAMPKSAGDPIRFELEVDDEDGLVAVAETALGNPFTATPIPVVPRGLAVLLAAALAAAVHLQRRGRRR